MPAKKIFDLLNVERALSKVTNTAEARLRHRAEEFESNASRWVDFDDCWEGLITRPTLDDAKTDLTGSTCCRPHSPFIEAAYNVVAVRIIKASNDIRESLMKSLAERWGRACQICGAEFDEIRSESICNVCRVSTSS